MFRAASLLRAWCLPGSLQIGGETIDGMFLRGLVDKHPLKFSKFWADLLKTAGLVSLTTSLFKFFFKNAPLKIHFKTGLVQLFALKSSTVVTHSSRRSSSKSRIYVFVSMARFVPRTTCGQ